MSLAKPTVYAPDLFKALHGIILVYKPPRFFSKELVGELKNRISDELNLYKPRPVDKHVVIEGHIGSEKSVIEKPNLADHPLVVGPRFLPWELPLSVASPHLGYRSSGLDVILLGSANRYFSRKFKIGKLVSIYHITGRFGHVTDTFFYDGKITDKSTFAHIRPGKIDAVLARIQASQHDRIFDSASVPLDSQEAYELAKNWPSRPPRMAKWPVIYRIRCIHLKLPLFKLEVTILNENEQLLAQIPHDVAQMLKSAAYTESIRRVKLGPFDVEQSLTDKDWTIESILDQCRVYQDDHERIKNMIDAHCRSLTIRSDHEIFKNKKNQQV